MLTAPLVFPEPTRRKDVRLLLRECARSVRPQNETFDMTAPHAAHRDHMQARRLPAGTIRQ